MRDHEAALLLFGTSHKLLGVDERETLAFSEDEIPDILAELVADPSIDEACVVSTCNRVEFYVAADSATCLPRLLRALYEQRRGIDIREYQNGFFLRKDIDAVRHLFRVISSLESMVLGEVEVVHQLKRMYQLATDAGTAGTILTRAFQDAFRVGKKVRSDTAISAGSTSVAMIAVESVLRYRGRLDDARATVVGAGPMARRMARYLNKRGVASLTLVNRTEAKVRALADELGAGHRPLDELDATIAESDVLLVGIHHKSGYLLGADAVRAIGARRDRPLIIVDIGVPRVVAHGSRAAGGVEVFDIDDLSPVLSNNIERRREAAREAEYIVERYADRYARSRSEAGDRRCTCNESPCLG